MHEPRRVGRFRIVARLGSGGMGVVYLGRDRRGHVAAVKVLRPELGALPAMRARFAREISAAQRVDATCVPRLFAWNTDANPPWMATEYVAGPTLEAFVTHHGPLSADALCSFAASTAEALAAIARVGLVHRDLKPSNVLINPAGPRVIDFGIAISDDAPTLTDTGERVGTPTWMAPEQARGDRVGPAADVFSWSALVAYAGTGAHPFGSGDPEAVLYRVLTRAHHLEGWLQRSPARCDEAWRAHRTNAHRSTACCASSSMRHRTRPLQPCRSASASCWRAIGTQRSRSSLRRAARDAFDEE